MLVMLNNRLVTLNGRNRGDPSFDIPSFHDPTLVKRPGSGVMSNIMFAHSRPAVAAFQLSEDIRTNAGINPGSRVSRETSETDHK